MADGGGHALAAVTAPGPLQRAWELSTLRPDAARALGQQVAAADGPDAADGWLVVALVDARSGDSALADAAAAALAQARRRWSGAAAGDGGNHGNHGNHADVAHDAAAVARGLALCDEIQAMLLRCAGDVDGAVALLSALDARDLQGAFERDAMHRFIGHDLRASIARLQGRPDTALLHFYAARDAAAATGWAGPRITALANLGAYHHDLFNADDARLLSEAALEQARAAGAHEAAVVAATTLIGVYHAAGEMQRAHTMASHLLQHVQAQLPAALPRCALALALGHLAVDDVDAALGYLKPGAAGATADGTGMAFRAWLTARCLLHRGDPARARSGAERTLRQRRQQRAADPPYDLLALYRVLTDACEQAGDAIAALTYLRQAHALYEQLVGRGVRARLTALERDHQLAEAQRERDLAVTRHRNVEDDHRRLAELNTALQAQVAETEKLHTQLREQALRDPLTGLHNRRYLFEMAPALLELARRQQKPLCVVLMDLDHFKLLNDTYGHAAGDLVLQRFSALLTQMLRRSDAVCRHGGEEFVAVMPDIDGAGAQAMLTRLLEAFQQQQNTLGTRRLPRGSFSAGIALFPAQGSTLEHLLSRADRGLYSAKNQGRARIELAPRTGFGSLS